MEKNGNQCKCYRWHWNKYMYCLYMLLAASLMVGWYPQRETKSLGEITGNALQKVEAMCLLDENNRLFLQGVAETDIAERRQCEQIDEYRRRTVKTIKKKKKKPEAVSGIGGKSRRILERIVEAEAGDQNLKGRLLVANVILNRVKSKKFPNTVKGVVFAHGQFSPVSNGRYYSVHVSRTTKKAVAKALQGKDDSRGALYFMCRSAANPKNAAWFDRDLKRLFAYGCHEFFR